MTTHNVRVYKGGSGLWYADCECDWSIRKAVEDGDCAMNGGSYGRRTSTAAQALADAHTARHTVAVPVTGTHLVVDGEVQDVKPGDVLVHRCGVGCSGTHGGPGTVRYTVTVRPPVPPFFEAGKTYELGHRKSFTVSYVDTHPGTGDQYAHGWMTDHLPGGDHVFPGSTSRMGEWKEKR